MPKLLVDAPVQVGGLVPGEDPPQVVPSVAEGLFVGLLFGLVHAGVDLHEGLGELPGPEDSSFLLLVGGEVEEDFLELELKGKVVEFIVLRSDVRHSGLLGR